MLPVFTPPNKNNTTGCILAGGRASRMGGVDKGLQVFRGQSLVQRAAQRLQPQVAEVMVNANRHVDVYTQMGLRVVADTECADQGPLSGFLTGLHHCHTEWLVTVPCDCPFFPLDLVNAMCATAAAQAYVVSVVASRPWPEQPQQDWLLQPVFCLMHRSVYGSLKDYLQNGGHKITDWALQHPQSGRCCYAGVDLGMDPFANANTLQELQALQA